mmetsp:Transcript_19739/g.39107  ORF Transcript_19739/g.39107 Transcript_19739/m.39107 type:complete len:241 (-) Transcript_19739:80-802(-)
MMDRIISWHQAKFQKTKLNIKTSGRILDLFSKSLVQKLAASLVSPHLKAPWVAQVAPLPGKHDMNWVQKGLAKFVAKFALNHLDAAQRLKLWHIDGVKIAEHNQDPDKIFNFTLLCGVYLSDIDQEFAGNFTVFPGSHHTIERYAQQHGTSVIKENGLPATAIALSSPVQLKVNRGDIMFAHYQLAHTVAPNWSANTRQAVYFRLFHKDHSPMGFRHESMSDIWLEYEHMWALLRAKGKR